MRVTFVMEQQVGHQSFYQNLRRFADVDARMQATWVEVTYAQASSRWNHVPWLPRHIRGTLIGRDQARRGLCQSSYDVAFFNTQVPAALGGRLARRRPYVLCTDATPIQYDHIGRHYGHLPDGSSVLARYKHRVNLALFKQAARVLAWSTWTRESLVNDYGLNADRIEVLPPGVDLKRWRPRSYKSAGPLRILFIGGDLVRKGGDDLVQAYRSLPRGLAELTLVTRTPLPASDGIHVYSELEPNSPELVALGQSCDVFVLPSRAEAFGIAAVEACALGIPVVATAVGGLAEVVVDGETGFLIRPGDWRMLAQRLFVLAEDRELCAQLGRAARLRAEAHFDARANAARIVSILSEVVSQAST